MKWAIILLGIASNASASVLIKVAMNPARGGLSLQKPLAILANWPLWLGITLYGCAFVLYALALARFPLNVAQPVLTSGAIATVTLISILMFDEPFHWTTGAGVFMIIAGVLLITARAG